MIYLCNIYEGTINVLQNKSPSRRNKNKKETSPKFEIAGWIITIVASFLFLCAILPMLLGPISGAITGFLWGVFGFSIYPMLVALITWGIFLIKGYKRAVPLLYIVCSAVIFLMLIFILHLAVTFSILELPFAEYIDRVFSDPISGGGVSAGGVVFGTIAYGLQSVLTAVFSFILFGLVIIAMVVLMVNRRLKFIPSIKGLRSRKKRGELEQEAQQERVRGDFARTNRQSQKVAPINNAGLYVDDIIPVGEYAYDLPPEMSAPYQSSGGSFSQMQEQQPSNTVATTTYSTEPLAEPLKVSTQKPTAFEILGLRGDKERVLQPFTSTSQPTKITAAPDIRATNELLSGVNPIINSVSGYSASSYSNSASTSSTLPPAYVHQGTSTKSYSSTLGEIAQIPEKNVVLPEYSGGEIVNGEEESARIKNAFAPIVASPVAMPTTKTAETKAKTSETPSPTAKPRSYGGGPDPSNYDSFSYTGFGRKVEGDDDEITEVLKKDALAKESIDFKFKPEVLFSDTQYARDDTPSVSIFDDKKITKTTETTTSYNSVFDVPFPYKKIPAPIEGQASVQDGEDFEGASFTEYTANDEPASAPLQVTKEMERLKKVWESPIADEPEPTQVISSTFTLEVNNDDVYKVEPILNGETGLFDKEYEDVPVDLTLNDSAYDKDDHSGYREEVKPVHEPVASARQFAPLKKSKPKAHDGQVAMDTYMAQKDSANSQDVPAKKRKLRYISPPLELLAESRITLHEDAEADKLARAETIVETLKSLKLDVKISGITRGPTVTRFELSMPPGVPVKTVKQFITDIEYYLECGKIRIETPIPGKRAVGIEAPNDKKDIVSLREIIESSAFKKSCSPLTFALGKDIAGENMVCEMDKMPHLLIAGTTGSGKSVQLNSIILSILYKSSPDDVRIILVDPKRVEFTDYAGMPHLLGENIINTDKHALNAFKWLRAEMERRYMLFSKNVVRNITEYNNLADVKSGEVPKIPFIVLIVDELADLMNGGFKKELEENIMSIAQKARAAGIHLILATQRPSVDVITGTIRANLPSRIAFALKTGGDSRIILDAMGAETLLGQGDMLFSPIGADDPKRIQAPWVSGDEVSSVIGYIKANNETDFNAQFDEAIVASEQVAQSGGGGGATAAIDDDLGYDPLLPQILKLVIEQNYATTSFIQRKFSMGYARAARIVDFMEAQGYISGIDGTKPRSVFITMDQFYEQFAEEE